MLKLTPEMLLVWVLNISFNEGVLDILCESAQI